MNTLTQDCLEIKVSDDVVWNSYIGEFEIWVDGTKTHARDEGVAWRMFRERKELARRHVERNPANEIPFDGRPVAVEPKAQVEEYGLDLPL